MTVKTFEGNLEHSHPKCTQCNRHCYSIYLGGKKERVAGFFVCKHCNVVYQLPQQKRCEFTEVKA